MLGTRTKAHLPAILFALCFTPVDNVPTLMNLFAQSQHPSLSLIMHTSVRLKNYIFQPACRQSRCHCHGLREVLVVVLVTSSAFSRTKSGRLSAPLQRGRLCSFALMTVARLHKSVDLRRGGPLVLRCHPGVSHQGGRRLFTLCCCSCLSHTVTYPSRVCSANSF